MLIRLLLLVAIATLGGCGIFGSTDNTEPPAPLVKFVPSLEVDLLWRADIGDSDKKQFLKLTPAYADALVFTASPKGRIRAFDFSNGDRVWETKLKQNITGGPGAGNGLVVVGSDDGTVIGLNAVDGAERWRSQVSSEILRTPQIQEGIVILRTGDGKIYGLRSDSGSRLWVYERKVPVLSLRGTSAPVVLADLVLAGLDNGKLVALQLETGKLFWEVQIAEPRGRNELERMVDIDANIIVSGDTIYVSSYQGRTVAIDIYSGRLFWEREVDSYAGMAVDEDALYVTDTQSHVWAFDRYSGASLWKQSKLQARQLTAPVIVGDFVVMGDLEGYLHWLRRDDGQFVARYDMGRAPIPVMPLVVEETVIAYTQKSRLVAVRAGSYEYIAMPEINEQTEAQAQEAPSGYRYGGDESAGLPEGALQ